MITIIYYHLMITDDHNYLLFIRRKSARRRRVKYAILDHNREEWVTQGCYHEVIII